MKILKCLEFYECPIGTIFSYWTPCVATGLFRKGETLYDKGRPFDFVVTDLLPTSYSNSNGLDNPILDDAGGRDGGYDEKQLFCVFDNNDISKLHKMLDNFSISDP